MSRPPRRFFTFAPLASMSLHSFLDANELEAFHSALNCFSDRCIRLHANRTSPDLPFAVFDVPWYRWGRRLVDSSTRPGAFLNYATADYYIQDAASLLPLALLAPKPAEAICDLCASPGGKASAIAELLGPSGFLLANESIRSRVDVLKYSLAKTGNPCFAVSSSDPEDLANHLCQTFDAVLVDAPCSGQSLVARNKRDENAFAANQIEHCSMRQRRILQSAIRMLKPGGRLIYSTCTFAIEENESQIRWLHEQHPFAWEPIEYPELKPWLSPLEAGCYRLWPHRDRCAGGFAAGLRLVQEIDFEPFDSSRHVSKLRPIPSAKSQNRDALEKQKSVRETLSSLGAFEEVTIDFQKGHAQCMTAGAKSQVGLHSRIAMDPMSLLIETGNHFVPTQGLAMLDRRYFTPSQAMDLNPGQAKQFASGASIAISGNPDSANFCETSGWAVATWNGQPLGWCKVLSNRLNNHLPPWARLNLR
jgi:16S rRNA C967 or C1407 C5-methylase (RsmB/RsmF family)